MSITTKFIASRATAHTLLSALSAHAPSVPPTNVVAPCDFRKSNVTFQVNNQHVKYKDMEIPRDVLVDARDNNVAYQVVCKGAKRMELLPLSIPSPEGPTFRLTEPLNDPDVEGPILYLHNLKMHLTKGFPTSLTFSKQLAEAAQIKKGHHVLDMFFGLGYCTLAALQMGASKVVSFEMYKEVLLLAEKNPFSPNMKDPRVICQQRDVINSIAQFFEELDRKGISYDSCIIDPAKKRVMEKVYSSRFLLSLSKHIVPGATVAAYVPEPGIAQKFQDMRENMVSTFESTGQFKYKGNYQDNRFIFCFERT